MKINKYKQKIMKIYINLIGKIKWMIIKRYMYDKNLCWIKMVHWAMGDYEYISLFDFLDAKIRNHEFKIIDGCKYCDKCEYYGINISEEG